MPGRSRDSFIYEAWPSRYSVEVLKDSSLTKNRTTLALEKQLAGTLIPLVFLLLCFQVLSAQNNNILQSEYPNAIGTASVESGL